MSLFAEAAIALAVCLAIFLPLFAVKRKILSSAPGAGVEVNIVIEAAGEAESLEYSCLAALREASASPFISGVVIRDGGLSPEARKLAEILTGEHDNLYITEAP